MKKLYSMITIMIMVLVCTTVKADIFVHQNESQLNISWSETGAFYYAVALENLTNGTKTIEESVFDPYITINGLAYHNIYKITVRAYDAYRDKWNDVGEKYITFALEETSSGCTCICPEFPKKVFYGIVAGNWWTGIAINNTGNESQAVTLKIGAVSKILVVPSHSTEAFLLSDLIEDTTPQQYPITYSADSPDVGITVLIGDGVNISAQN